MESIIDTNKTSQWVRLRFRRWLGEPADLGPVYGAGKHGIVSTLGLQRQVLRAGLAISFFHVFLGIAGCRRETVTPRAGASVTQTRITGASMSPTFWGDQAEITCRGCGIQWRANWQVEMRPTADIQCWNCGFQIDFDVDDVQANLGDLIEVDTDAYQEKEASPNIGDVVAIRDSQGTRIKRIVAVPGQTVSVRDGNLFCDGQKLTSPAPWVEVHNDAFRREGKSWWQPVVQNSTQPAGWTQMSNGFSISLEGPESKSAMLFYGHRSPYQGMRPDRVRDDYACNLAENRMLHEVDELSVTASAEVTRETQLLWWTWRQTKPLCQSQRLQEGRQRIEMRWDKPEAIDFEASIPADLHPEKPICLVIQHGSMSLSDITIHRPIIYWIDERQSLVNFPLVLKPREYFVVGDNVPLSVDSRRHGVVSRGQIVGKVVTKPILIGGESTEHQW